jgi:type II secretory pathway predicted ATPase ExeA
MTRFAERIPLRLKGVLLRLGISHGDLAKAVPKADGHPISRTAIAHILNHGYRPAKMDWAAMQARIRQYLAERGATPAELESAWEVDDNNERWSHKPAGFNTPSTPTDDEDDSTRITPEMLSPQARRHFNLFRDPFQDDVQGPDDIYLSADQRYIREAMFQASRQGGWLMAVVGESGSGKTTLRRETIDRINRESLPVIVIQPKAIDKTQLNARHICEAILYDLQPNCKPKRSLEALSRQVEKSLIESGRSGYTHVVIIEEAHDLLIQTLKYLKRFWEMEDGFKKLLSIELIGQPELRDKLDERRYPDAREVIRRCEVLELKPLDGGVGDYLALKFKRLGAELSQVIDQGGIDALRQRLTEVGRGPRRNVSLSMTYPLVVNNLMVRAMNEAARIGAACITADILMGA